MPQVRARHIAVIRFLCGLGIQFSATDFRGNAITYSGHRFLQTIFKIQRNGGRSSVYYCPCGEMAVRDDSLGDFVIFASDASSGQVQACRLGKLT